MRWLTLMPCVSNKSCSTQNTTTVQGYVQGWLTSDFCQSISPCHEAAADLWAAAAWAALCLALATSTSICFWDDSEASCTDSTYTQHVR